MSTVNVEHMDLSVPYGNEFLGTPDHILLTPILEKTAFAITSKLLLKEHVWIIFTIIFYFNISCNFCFLN